MIKVLSERVFIMFFKSDNDNDEPRFAVVRTEGKPIYNDFREEIRVIVDRETGVNYLWVQNIQAGGLTPLLDKDGKPIITKR